MRIDDQLRFEWSVRHAVPKHHSRQLRRASQGDRVGKDAPVDSSMATGAASGWQVANQPYLYDWLLHTWPRVLEFHRVRHEDARIRNRSRMVLHLLKTLALLDTP